MRSSRRDGRPRRRAGDCGLRRNHRQRPAPGGDSCGGARIGSAEVELRLLEREVRDAKTELAQIVRDARRHGAEPGWFR